MVDQHQHTNRELPLLEPLLGIHAAPNVSWLGDAACTAGERGLGAQHALFFTVDDSGALAGQRPASAVRQRGLLKLQQALSVDLTALKFDPASRPLVAAALESGSAAILELEEALPLALEPERLAAVQKQLGVGVAWLAPLRTAGEAQGLILFLMPPQPPSTLAQAELLGRHAAQALANLQEREAGRKRGELDAVRWIYDERRFAEELTQEARRAQRHERPLSLLYLRVLNLADLQRRYGRFLVERILRQVSARLSEAMRDTDFLGAAGDDGFGAILIEADLDGAVRAKERLLEGLGRISLPGVDLPGLEVELSCATSTLPHDGVDINELTDAAEARLKGEEPATVRVGEGNGAQQEAAEPVLSRLAKRIQRKG